MIRSIDDARRIFVAEQHHWLNVRGSTGIDSKRWDARLTAMGEALGLDVGAECVVWWTDPLSLRELTHLLRESEQPTRSVTELYRQLHRRIVRHVQMMRDMDHYVPVSHWSREMVDERQNGPHAIRGIAALLRLSRLRVIAIAREHQERLAWNQGRCDH